MPRGGGGGFRGGGFGGGGFRGGGFRGGSGSFRSGRVRSSGRPFGRTGARRTVSRSPRSSGRRTYWHRPYRSYWGHHYRPWYRRWWYWDWWWGYPYRPWYYAPVYWGGGLVLAILALLIVLPVIGLALIPYPFSSADSNGLITYRSTETLYYNEYWYEVENVPSGTTIDYYVEAISPSDQGVTFIIADRQFNNFPTSKTLTGTYEEQDMYVKANHDYQYLGYFLKPGSELNYSFTVTEGTIYFFLTDANNLNRWNNWEDITPEDSYSGSDGYRGSFIVPYAQDWYLVWYNPYSTPAKVNLSVDYTALGVYDFSSAPVVIENVNDPVSGTYTVPTDGDWYFFIYVDPFSNPDQSVEITFDISFDTGITSVDRWQDLRPVLTFLAIIIVVLLIVAIVQRRNSKRRQQTVTTASTTISTTPNASPTGEISTTTATTSATKAGECHRCKYPYKMGDVYCTNCGAKLIGRDYGSSDITTPASSKKCKSCGNKLLPDSKYCKYCGAKVVNDKGYSFFPDERKSFFCQLDGEKHPSTDSAYQCDNCSRMICSDCYDDAAQAGVTKCPYCQGHLTKIQ